MANFQNLIQAIKSIVYDNDDQLITGGKLQQVLVNILNTQSTEGRLFAGIAIPTTNPGTPDSNVYYLAAKSGHYTNFGDPGGGISKGEISILYNNSSGNWQKERLLYNFEVNHENAYTDDFLAIDDFAKADSIKDLTGTNRQNAVRDALNKWLDNVAFTNTEDEIKKLGRCRLFCDGINIECYNYIVGFDGPNGIQTVSGPCDLMVNNKINYVSLEYNQIYRTKHDGVWGNWKKASNSIILSQDELDNLSDDLITKIIKGQITKATIIEGNYYLGKADFVSDSLGHVLNIVYTTHSILKYPDDIIKPVIQKGEGNLTNAHDDKLVYVYQKTYNNYASHTGGDVPSTQKTWSKWKLIGGTAYNNEILEFLLSALNKNSEQDKKLTLLEQKTLHENAYTDDFLAVEDFAKADSIKDLTGTNRQNAVRDALNKWLDNVAFTDTEDEIKKLGRCRLFCDGINIECYNYIVGFDGPNGIQTVSGPCDLMVNNKINYVSLEYNQIYRTKHDGVWGNWKKK